MPDFAQGITSGSEQATICGTELEIRSAKFKASILCTVLKIYFEQVAFKLCVYPGVMGLYIWVEIDKLI